MYRRLGALLGMSAGHIEALVIKGRTALPYAPVTIKTAAGRGVLTELAEAPERIPRRHPAARLDPLLSIWRDGRAGARLRPARSTKESSKNRPSVAFQQGTVVGQGRARVLLRPVSARARGRAARAGQLGRLPRADAPAAATSKAGYSLGTTLDLGLQREGEKALLEESKTPARAAKPAIAGAFTALDPLNGEVLAIGSYPSFDPNKFAKPLTEGEYKTLEGKSGGEETPSRLVNRAVNGAYPTGSTFKRSRRWRRSKGV